MDFMREAENISSQIVEDRRRLHRCAEIGFDLTETTAHVVGRLRNMGLRPIKVGKCGIVAQIGNGDGKCIMLRADMDALPIAEKCELPFSSDNGNMHACGHDLHTAMLLGAADILSKNSDKIQGRVLLCFQGAEEILAGAQDMIENGIIDKYKPDMAIMIHTIVGIDLERDTVIISSPGVSAASADFFSIRISGASSHGATPHLSRDALFCANEIYRAIYTIPVRELSVDDGATLSVGALFGGEAANVIADTAVIKGTCRTFSGSARDKLKSRIGEYATAIAKMHDVECEVDFYAGAPTLINDADVSARAYACVNELIGRKCIYSADLGTRGGGSEDFAYFSHLIPSLMIGLMAGAVEDGYNVGAHNPRTVFDERALALGAAIYAKCAIDLLK